MRAGGAISPSLTTESATCSSRRAICPARSWNFAPAWPSRKALADADAGNAGWRRDLSVSHDRIGDVLVAQGDLPAALGEFRAGMAIARALADADPGHAGVAARSLRLSQ
jgi:hypothetical protein